MAEKDPTFLAKALVYARTKGLMKLAPVVGLTVLSAHEKTAKKTNFRAAFQHVVKTPDDLREFVSLCRTGEIRKGLGGEARDAVKRWLQHISEYHAVKYGSARSEDITLRDIIRMAHPRPVNRAQEELFGWLVKGWQSVGASPSPTNPLVWALETLKRSTDEAQIIDLVVKYRLPWEVVVPSVKKMTVNIWKALLAGMPYMALLRNLATMERHDVFKDDAVAKLVAGKLSDKENVRKSKQFPFRFFNAFQAFQGHQAVKDAIVDALEQSFENVETLPGRVCISNDVSGSMSSQVSDRGSTRMCDIAGLFGAALFKKQENVILLPFENGVRTDLTKGLSRRSTIMDIAAKIGVAIGGTNLGAPIEYLGHRGLVIDTFIGITDSEDWAGSGFLTAWEKYKRTRSPKAKAVLINIAPYRDWVAPAGYPDVHYVSGWSDSVLRYIPLVVNGTSNQVEEVRKIDLDTFGKEKADSE
jgi:60 kDa SS-A/Ro ribonucleoprotein